MCAQGIQQVPAAVFCWKHAGQELCGAQRPCQVGPRLRHQGALPGSTIGTQRCPLLCRPATKRCAGGTGGKAAAQETEGWGSHASRVQAGRQAGRGALKGAGEAQHPAGSSCAAYGGSGNGGSPAHPHLWQREVCRVEGEVAPSIHVVDLRRTAHTHARRRRSGSAAPSHTSPDVLGPPRH